MYPFGITNKKLNPKSEYSCYVGMERDGKLTINYVAVSKSIQKVCLYDFYALSSSNVLSLSSIVDGLSFKANKTNLSKVQKIKAMKNYSHIYQKLI